MVLLRLAAVAALLVVCPAVARAQSVAVSGTVRAERDKRPVAGAVVTLTGTSAEATSDAEGRFTLPGVAPGAYTVVVTRGGFAPATSDVTVTASGTAALDVLLPDGLLVSETLTVQGRLSDYVETSAMATRSSARLIDIPQAIAVLPARLLEDIGALDTKDLYRHISGVVDSPYSSTVVRGFTQREVLVNGMRGNPFGSLEGDVASSGFSTSQFRLTNVERVEVLKGPASVLYGAGEPGGVINYVTKKPKDTFQVRAVTGTARFNQRLGEIDVTGPANASRTVLYRAAAYYEERDHFRRPASEQNLHLTAGLTWRVTPKAALSAEYEFLDQDMGGHRLRGVPVNAAGSFLADIRWSATEPTDFTTLKAHVAQLRWDQAFARGIRLDSTLRYLQYDREEEYHEPRGITADGLFMQREFRDQLRTNDDVSWNTTLSIPWTTGRVKHDIALGGDIYRQDHLFRSATALQRSRGGPVGNV
ncbi:MAG: TonB-dependent receptor, partial [Acidobacteria bacterium]|nr:TonB-dependent receptor [Acidobacteriota bacterium]